MGFGSRILESSWSRSRVSDELDPLGEDKKRHRSRRKTWGHNYAEGMGEIVGTKRADGEGVSRETTTPGCPRTTGGESFEKGTVNQQRNPAAQ